MSGTEPSWELYETFLSVMRTGSLSGASRALAVAQPTVRRRIEALEASLGAVLFTRATNGLVPTDAARVTRPHAEAMAASAHALVRATSGPLEAERGTVRVTASEIVGLEVLPGLLAPFRAQWPELQLELALSNRLEDLLRRDADVAIRMTAPTQSSLVARKVGVIPVGLFAHRDYLARHPAPKKPAELLKGHALIGADRDRSLINAVSALGLNLSPRDFSIRTDSDGAQLNAVRAGLGIGVCQVPLGERTAALVRVLPKVAIPLEVWVVMHEDQRSVRRVRLVFEHLVKSLGDYTRSGALAAALHSRR
jgi:DNA-binding transcriptional LysR family regulator